MDFLPFTRPTIDDEVIRLVTEVLRSGWITTGPKVNEFEKSLAAYVSSDTGKVPYVKVFTSATGALETALQVMGIGEGDEVIVPAMTFTASANVVALVGAKPVLVDVDLKTRNLTIEGVKKAITSRTKCIMPVHFAGLPVDMDPLYELAKQHNIRVLEDAAHAIGTRYKNRKIGSFGDMISFSFHPNKNMTTIEGGALVLWKEAEAQQVDLLRFHGLQKDAFGNMDVLMPARKFNMPDVSAAVGIAQLKRLDEFCSKRLKLVDTYYQLLNHPLLNLPERGDDGHCWHIFSPLINFTQLGMTRPQFIQKMADEKIGIGVHYQALTTFTAYKDMGYSCPQAERIGRETVTLPLFPAMTKVDVERVCQTVLRYLN
ncbi:MAG: DegT/DnrJ/EryC1/StrS family aminotransferase [Bdellovibrionaceae bacterium]|nr:DegT/DnrJ/EryC1/StrS family aminotransferase [Pseudobdellovibrionaceae bacterium]